MMTINRSAAMALFLTLSFVLLLVTGGKADADELSTSSQHAVRESSAPAPAPKGYETLRGPLQATRGDRQREINIGPCFPSRGSNALSNDRGNAPSCPKRCTSKGYAGGHCNIVSGGFPGDCFCVKA